MVSYCLKCSKNTESKSPKVVKTNKETIVLSSIFAVCNSKKSKFVKKQEAERLISIIHQVLLLFPLLI